MTGIEDRPSLAERYSAAVESSNLRVKETRGDTDYLIAAGWSGSSIGPNLLRLRKDYDAIKRGRDLANKTLTGVWPEKLSRLDAQVAAERAKPSADPVRLVRIQREADALRAEIAGYAQSETAFSLMELGDNLGRVKQQLAEHAVVEATRVRLMEDDQKAAYLAGRALLAWLDPNCPKCDGRGFTGGGRHEMSGAPIRCRACGETGNRKMSIGNSDAQRDFAAHILSLIAQTVEAAERGMERRLRE